MRTRRIPARRGLAMMMVLFAIAMASILATAYLSSRDNSAPISANISHSAGARWAALSGLETAIAVLQTDTDWRNNHVNGVLLSNYPLAGADITIELRDMVTGGPPNDASEYIEVTAMATVDGVTQTATAEAYVSSVSPGTIAVDLSDFAIFAIDSLTMSGQATVARWPMAPLADVGRRVAVGTRATGSGDIRLSDDAACIDCTLYHRSSASATLLINNGTGPAIEKVAMADAIPMPDELEPGVSSDSGNPDLNVFGTSQTVSADTRFDKVTLNNGTLTLQGNITVALDTDLIMTNGKLVVDGNVKLVIFDDFETYTGSRVLLMPGASLRGFVGDDLWINDSFIGENGGEATWDNSGAAPHFDPHRLVIFELETGQIQDWYLKGNSIMKGAIYGKATALLVTDTSALYGRVAARDVTISLDGAIFYDHGVDTRHGFTNPESAVFDDGDLGTIKASVSGLSSLNPGDLAALGNTLDLFVIALGVTYGPGPSEPPPPPPGPGDPKPRPVVVEYSIKSFGSDMTQWEEANKGSG